MENKKPANPLNNRNFRLLWIGESISMLGDQFAFIALPWLVLQLTGSSIALGSVLAIMAIPRAIFMLVGGAIVDKLSPKNVTLLSNGARFILVSIVTVLILTNLITLPVLFVFAFLFGISDAFYFPAQNALVPQLVDSDQLQSGNAYIQGTGQLATLLGPALAGIIISSFSPHIKSLSPHTLGIGIAMLIDALSFIATIITVWMISVKPANASSEEKNQNLLSSITTAFHFVWNSQTLRIILLIVMVINFFIVGPFTVGIPVLAQKKLSEGAAAYGIIIAAFGAGGLLGVIVAGVLPKIKANFFGSMIMVLIAVQGILLALTPFSSSTLVIAAISLGMGALNGYTNLVAFTWLQKQIPKS